MRFNCRLGRLVAAGCLVALVGVFAAGCSSGGGKLASIQKAGKLVVYTDPNFPPFEFVGANMEVVGVDMEIAKAIAAELGVSGEVKESDFDAIITAVKSGKGDVSVSGFTITEERAKSVDFSKPYINSAQYLILPENGSNVLHAEDLAGLVVGIAKGYSGQFWLEDEIDGGVLKDTGATVKTYNSAIDAALDLKAGRISAVVMDEYVAINVAGKTEGLKAIPLTYADGSAVAEEYGVVLPKGNDDLLKKINEVVERLISEGKIAEWVVSFSQ